MRLIGYLIFLSCTFIWSQVSFAQSEVTPAEKKEYEEIESFFSTGVSDSTQSRGNAFLRSHPRSPLVPSVENLLGLTLLKDRRASQAISHFKNAAQQSASQGFRQYILFNLASAQIEARLLDDAEETVRDIHPELLDKANQTKVIYLQATVYEKKGRSLEAVRYLLDIVKQFSEADLKENRGPIEKLLGQALLGLSDVSQLQKIYEEYELNPMVDPLLFRLGSQEISLGNTNSGEAHLKKLINSFPASSHLLQATEIVANLRNYSSVDSHAIGVLLPFKGKFSKFGNKSLQAIEAALGIFSQNEPDTRLKLYLEDSGDDSDSAIRGLNRLVFKHRVVAVLGPMLSKGIDQVSQRAQELGVPLISLSRRASLQQDFVFQAGLTQQVQTYEIARHAIQNMGLKTFAILYPNEKLETEIAYSFWDAVDSLGGEIVGIESYAPGETDFRQVVDKLSGLYYTEARQSELDALAQERSTNHVTKKTRKTGKFYDLPPIVDYQAVFIPDEAKIAGQILPTFSYRDVENVKFLGTSSWNTADFVTRAQNNGENSFFVDAYLPESSSNSLRKFQDNYKSTFGQEPTSLEVIAYDAAKILNSILTSNSNASRNEVREQLKSIKDFPGLSGKMNFKEGQFYRELRVITTKGGQLKETESPPSGGSVK